MNAWNGEEFESLPAVPKDPTRYLSEVDLMTLGDGFRPGYTVADRRRAEDVLRRLGWEKKTRASKKPGPKKRDRVNPTDEMLRRLVQTARAILGLSEGIPRSTTLSILCEVLRRAEHVIQRNFLITNFERCRLQEIQRGFAKSEYEIVRRCGLLLIACVDELADSGAHWDFSLASFVEVTLEAVQSRNGRGDDGQSFNALASIVMLDSSLRPRAARKDITPIFAKDLMPTRAQILLGAIGRLHHLNSVFLSAEYALSGRASEAVIEFLGENEPTTLHGGEDVFRALGELSDLFLTIGRRQGVYPKVSMLEDAVFDPPEFAEGQISKGDQSINAILPPEQTIRAVEKTVAPRRGTIQPAHFGTQASRKRS